MSVLGILDLPHHLVPLDLLAIQLEAPEVLEEDLVLLKALRFYLSLSLISNSLDALLLALEAH